MQLDPKRVAQAADQALELEADAAVLESQAAAHRSRAALLRRTWGIPLPREATQWCPYCKRDHVNPSVRFDRGGYTHFCHEAVRTGCTCDGEQNQAAAGNPQYHDQHCRLRYA